MGHLRSEVSGELETLHSTGVHHVGHSLTVIHAGAVKPLTLALAAPLARYFVQWPKACFIPCLWKLFLSNVSPFLLSFMDGPFGASADL